LIATFEANPYGPALREALLWFVNALHISSKHPREVNTPKYSRPILSIIFNIFAFLLFAAAGLGVWYAIWSKSEALLLPPLGLVVAGVFYMGVSQVINYLAQTAYNTGRLVALAEANAFATLATMTGTRGTSTPVTTTTAEPAYFYATGEGQEGPFAAHDLRQLRDARMIHLKTPVLRQGEDAWKSYGDYPELQ
jgi:hypothetical protein